MFYGKTIAIAVLAVAGGLAGTGAAAASVESRSQACMTTWQPIGNKNTVEICRQAPDALTAEMMGNTSMRRAPRRSTLPIGNKLTVDVLNP